MLRKLPIWVAAGFCAATSWAAGDLDTQLQSVLKNAGFTGAVESTLAQRLGRPLNPALAQVGRMLFFDKAGALHQDNMCGGCHSPSNGMGDSQSMAIGIQNNDVVGPNRRGPRNQRRTPTVVNTAFYPKLMWNGRFAVNSGDPFDSSAGFTFPLPEGTTYFTPGDPRIYHLLVAQAHMPPTELTEVAGYTGSCGKGWLPDIFCVFDDGKGSPLPAPDAGGYFNEPIRRYLLANRLNTNPIYVAAFTLLFPAEMQHNGGKIDFSMFARAIAEFEFSLVFANAPIDQYARGDVSAMNDSQKRGALVFFGKGGCVSCHAVGGQSNEMFSDFQNHVIGVPQVAPYFGVQKGNVPFDGPGQNEDFGLEQVTGNSNDRYKFRTAPLRNLAVSAGFFHNGAYTRLEDAIRFHLNPAQEAPNYNAHAAGLDVDLTYVLGPIQPVLSRLDPAMQPVSLSGEELSDLFHFIRDALLDSRAKNTCSQAPAAVPSGMSLPKFQGCN